METYWGIHSFKKKSQKPLSTVIESFVVFEDGASSILIYICIK